MLFGDFRGKERAGKTVWCEQRSVPVAHFALSQQVFDAQRG